MASSGHETPRITDDAILTTTYTDPETRTLSTAVAEAIATAANEDPTASSFRLHDWIDPDALDRLFTHRQRTGGEWTVEFTTTDYTVTVSSDGLIAVQ